MKDREETVKLSLPSQERRKEADLSMGRGRWGQKNYRANGTLPLPSWVSFVNDLECFGRKTKIEN